MSAPCVQVVAERRLAEAGAGAGAGAGAKKALWPLLVVLVLRQRRRRQGRKLYEVRRALWSLSLLRLLSLLSP